MQVSAVIPNYNGLALLKNNLPVIVKELQGSEVIVVDDGFSTAVNLGIKAASNELVLLINTDVVPTKDFLKYLLPHFENPKIFAVGCLDKSIEGDQVTLRGRGTGK